MSDVVEEEPIEDENSLKEGSYFLPQDDIDKKSASFTYAEEETINVS